MRSGTLHLSKNKRVEAESAIKHGVTQKTSIRLIIAMGTFGKINVDKILKVCIINV